MEEQIFLDEKNIQVTNVRFMLPQQTYAISGITSVKNSKEPPGCLLSMVFMVIGIICLMTGAGISAMIFSAMAIVLFVAPKTKYHVALFTSGGEIKAYTSTDGAHIARVVEAINNAIVARG